MGSLSPAPVSSLSGMEEIYQYKANINKKAEVEIEQSLSHLQL